ncbi:TPA: acetyltransferase [Enterobacter ludwigii]|jgi:sugar O-acyltransferase (sialic acid O-acetyltransferase NeuD family)|uniref:acetyltransferase n=1 Tax=Enterobacter TaxID=547 RepID=UPI000795F45B|nr:acetyltransferase [Enterobacter ludwigii]MBB2843476.1 sugar O-acyltransferase (sialic acid O-acetyltransferase NeuD family) [Enterobacter ludwigii]MBG0577805.1 acetyltransferase [Enterobacter ludwigii]RBO24961.1 sugar O-acyltransferase [Enterobacter ludwigii]CZY72387.1 acetyltransferase [Enterobacter ludwigii]SAH11112.1 acetyltransferase [Enterobacter ludwigii]
MKLAIYGAGGLGREVLELAQEINATESRWDALCLIDDNPQFDQLNSYPVVTLHALIPDECEIVIAVGEPSLRRALGQRAFEGGFRLATLVHPSARLSPSCTLGEGCVISYGAFISCDTVISRNVHLQPNASLGHDCYIGQDSIISSYANLAGKCRIGERVFIGMNAVIRETTAIGDDTVVSMGAAVFNDIAPTMIVMGNPARAIRPNIDNKVFK